MRINKRTTIIGVTLVAASICLATFSSMRSGDRTIDDAYRFEHVGNIAGQYADALLSLKDSPEATNLRMMDIVSKAYALQQQGEEELSLYFRASLQEKVRQADPQLARTLFGEGGRNVFLRHQTSAAES